MKKKRSLSLAMASLALTGSLTGCHIDKEQLEEIKATLTSEELAAVMQILEDNNIVIGADGIDLPEHIQLIMKNPMMSTVLYGPYIVMPDDPIVTPDKPIVAPDINPNVVPFPGLK
ncbi:MAG: hypothetical protein E7583_06030 [Ruminococcaceae bacterium]|nr:hypothetical protein [Oscillospiraceae bacterium]